MPELPEVEVTRRGIAPQLEGRTLTAAVVRNRSLRWPVPAGLERTLKGLTVTHVGRRGKYLLIECARAIQPAPATATAVTAAPVASALATSAPATATRVTAGWLIVHLGMSGSLRFVAPGTAPRKHEHVDLATAETILRLHDPRRFGAVLWHPATQGPVLGHALLTKLGVEPLDGQFDGTTLYQGSRGRSAAVKPFLLAGEVVVGVGNIYASEALFRARIHPATAAGRISRVRYAKLAQEIIAVLGEAISKGGSTLRDFSSDGAPGYFQLEYFVYGREGEPCRVCAAPVRALRQGQRSTFYCARCQK